MKHEPTGGIRWRAWLGRCRHIAWQYCEILRLSFLLALARLDTQCLKFLICLRECGFQLGDFVVSPVHWRVHALELLKFFSFGHWFHNGDDERPNDPSSSTRPKEDPE